MGLEPRTTKDDVRRCLQRWDQGDNGIIPLSEVERRAILRALEYTRGDRAVAAHLLGIGRTTLYRKLKEYEVAV